MIRLKQSKNFSNNTLHSIGWRIKKLKLNIYDKFIERIVPARKQININNTTRPSTNQKGKNLKNVG